MQLNVLYCDHLLSHFDLANIIYALIYTSRLMSLTAKSPSLFKTLPLSPQDLYASSETYKVLCPQELYIGHAFSLYGC